MNTLKAVYSKLFKEETTNLASHEVNLALLNDLSTFVKNAKTSAANYAKQKALIEKNITAIKSAVENLKTNKDYGKKTVAQAQKFKGQFDKLSKELGINLAGSEADKLLSELFMLGEDSQGYIDDALSILNTIK